MLVIGLTGGIASGKSAASDEFEALGVPVIDADRLARELVEPGQPALAEIRRSFGPEVLTESGALDRVALRDRVFADPPARRRLEAILHPRIRTAMRGRLAELDAPYALLVIPLLVETGQQDLVDRILVIDAPEAQQRDRLAARDGSSTAEIDRILGAQTSRDRRLAAADDVIDNSGDRARLRRAVVELHHKYLALAGSDSNNALPTPPP